MSCAEARAYTPLAEVISLLLIKCACINDNQILTVVTTVVTASIVDCTVTWGFNRFFSWIHNSSGVHIIF